MRGVALLAGFALAVAALTAPVRASEPAKRSAASMSNVMREPLSGDTSREVVAVAVVLPPGADTGRRSRPGDQYIVVQEGEVRVMVDGFPPKLFKAGEGYHINPGAMYRYENASSDKEARTTEFLIAAKSAARTDKTN